MTDLPPVSGSDDFVAAHTVKDSRSSEESKQTPAVLGSRGEKPAAAVTPDASQCDSEGATGSASQSSAAQRHPWEHGPVVTRLLAFVNVVLIPYVAWKFPAEARAYTRRSFGAVFRGH